MKFSLNLYVDGQAEELIDFFKHAEAAGFDRVWTQEGDRSALTSASLLAPHAKHIKLATGVAHAFTRPPFETARCALASRCGLARGAAWARGSRSIRLRFRDDRDTCVCDLFRSQGGAA